MKFRFFLICLVGLLVLPVTEANATNYSARAAEEAAWIASAQVPAPPPGTSRPSAGAIGIHPSDSPLVIHPYDSNVAARGMLRGGGTYRPKVKAWIQWYLANLNWGVPGEVDATVYNHTVNKTTWVQTKGNSYDAADSQAATFISMLADWVKYSDAAGDTTARTYVVTNRYSIESVANVMTNSRIKASDNLTRDLPDTGAKRLMDNAEVVHGLEDAEWIADSIWVDAAAGDWFNAHRGQVITAIDVELWQANVEGGIYSTAKHNDGTKDVVSWSTWYPATFAQTFPILHNVVASGSQRANYLWPKVNAHGGAGSWTSCNKAGEPYSEVAVTAAIKAQTTQVSTYIDNCKLVWASRVWPYHVRHAGNVALAAGIVGGF